MARRVVGRRPRALSDGRSEPIRRRAPTPTHASLGAFAVASFSLAGKLVDPDTKDVDRKGDPSLSLLVGSEQWRQKYIFLAPDDYDVSFIDLAVPNAVTVTLDGAKVTDAPTTITPDFSVIRVKLGAGNKGAHVLTATKPVGLQVMGYGRYTSYQYPGGLNLKRIAPPPPR